MDQFEQFYADHAVDGVLSDEDTARMLALPVGQGDTGANPPESDVPDVVPEAKPPVEEVVAATPAVVPPAEPQPVLLAKDGVHTIEYQKLVDAREEARRWEQAATERAAELETLKKAPAPVAAAAPAVTPATPAPADVVSGDLFGDFSEEGILKGVEKVIEARVAAVTATLEAKFEQALAPVQKQAQTDAATSHYTTIFTAHPDVESVVESAEMKAFIDKQPSFLRAQFEHVLDKGSATEVVELLNLYKASKPQPSQATTPDPAAKAREIVAQVKTPAPTSLSEIPAGSAAHHDETGAMLEMSDAALMTKFDGKSSEQILALMSKVL